MLHSGEGGGSGGLSPNIAEAPTRVTISFNRTINDFGNGSSSVPSPNGSLWMIKHISYEVHGFRLLNCVHCSLTDLTLLSVPGKAVIIDRGSSDVEIDGLVMDLLESPTLNSTRLMSGAADGVFASLSKGNIRIQNSRFGFHGDDAVNAHTAVSLFAVRYANATVDTSGNASLPALRYDEIHVSRSPAWRMWFSPGDTLEFFNATSYERANVTRTVVRASYSPGRGGTWTLALDAPLNPAIAPFAPNATHPFAPIPHLGLVNNAYLMRNVVIRNLTTHHHRARGVLVSPTANALLADSSFTHVQMSGILVRACAACQEGMGTSGVLVENCTLDAVDRTGWHGGIAVDATDRGWRSVGWPGLQAGVEVRETGIVNVPGPAIIMRGAASPVVFGNRFSADRTPPYEPAVAGRVLLDGCNDVVRGNNSIYSDKEGGWIRE
ncbi:hypothetical protein DFJ74DRAFT_660144 [Hyaloraphidium curvatum]|nr:hypothetical protein DFJ74DRAFT_660144 [Hyaloraphidium curvatum]